MGQYIQKSMLACNMLFLLYVRAYPLCFEKRGFMRKPTLKADGRNSCVKVTCIVDPAFHLNLLSNEFPPPSLLCSSQTKASRGPCQVCVNTGHLSFLNKHLMCWISHEDSLIEAVWYLTLQQSAPACYLSHIGELLTFLLLSSFRCKSTGKVNGIIRAV